MDQGATVPRPVSIGDGSQRGINVCILPGVVIGRNCVVGVGANRVVTGSFPERRVIGRFPAKLLREFVHDAER